MRGNPGGAATKQQAEPVVPVASSSSMASVSAEKKRRADMAAQRRQRIMANMANLQHNFIKTNEVLFKVSSLLLLHMLYSMNVLKAPTIANLLC